METNPLIQKVIKCSYLVHKELGPGFTEKIYERSLDIALKELGIKTAIQFPIPVYFHEHLVGEYFADILVEGTLLVELKAVAAIDSSHKSQVLNYLKATRNSMGLLINFGTQKLEINRLYNNHLRQS